MKAPTETLSWQFTYLGFATLFGYNAILNVQPALFKDDVFTAAYEKMFTVIYGASMAIAILPLIFIAAHVIPKNPRSYAGAALMFAGLGLAALCAFIKPASNTLGLFLIGLLGVGTAIVQGFYFGEAASHSGAAIGRYSVGQALAGLACLPLSLFLSRVVFSNANENEPYYTMASLLFLGALVVGGSAPVYVLFVRKSLELKENTETLDAPDSRQVPRRSYIAILKDIWPMTVAIFANFVLLFVVFPSHIPTWNMENKWIPALQPGRPFCFDFGIIAFFVYNVADVLGRQLVAWGLKLNRVGVISVTLARIGTLALWYMATNAKTGFFHSEIVRLVLMVLHTVSQGFVVTWAFILAPAHITIGAEQPIVGNMNTLALVTGIMVGAALNAPLDKLIV